MATKKKVPEGGTITTSIDDEAVEKLKGLFASSAPDISTIASSDDIGKTLTVDPTSGYYTWTTTTPGPWYVSPTISATPRDAASEDATPYADGFLPHLVRAKEEGIRRGIEMDTVVIDRGVAVSIGLDPEKSHVDMILGLKVKYAKEKSLPMDSAFVLLKEKKKEKPGTAKKTTPDKIDKGAKPAGVGYGASVDVSPEEDEAWAEKERTSPVSGTTGEEILSSRRDATSSYGKRFISFPYDEDKKPILLSVDKIVCVEDKYVGGDPSLGWLGLEITFEIAGKERVIIIKDKEIARHIWDDLRTTMVYNMK